MANHVGESSASVNAGGKDPGSFECNICLELAQDPVVTLCGHLFCWPCLYEWLHVHAHFPECPVCKAGVQEEKLVPLYGRGKASTGSRSRSAAGVQIPGRPTGQRHGTAPPPDHRHDHYPNPNPWFVGGGGTMAGGRWGNYTFSGAIGGLFPLLNFQAHGVPAGLWTRCRASLRVWRAFFPWVAWAWFPAPRPRTAGPADRCLLEGAAGPSWCACNCQLDCILDLCTFEATARVCCLFGVLGPV